MDPRREWQGMSRRVSASTCWVMFLWISILQYTHGYHKCESHSHPARRCVLFYSIPIKMFSPERKAIQLSPFTNDNVPKLVIAVVEKLKRFLRGRNIDCSYLSVWNRLRNRFRMHIVYRNKREDLFDVLNWKIVINKLEQTSVSARCDNNSLPQINFPFPKQWPARAQS